jgi:signal transduction histidine kinase
LPDQLPVRTYSFKIFIKTENKENFIILIVKDNGLGIPKGNLNKIFNMFKRFHDQLEGTGIGLYIVKRILDNAGGKVEVDSEEGIGTTFRIYFAKRDKKCCGKYR